MLLLILDEKKEERERKRRKMIKEKTNKRIGCLPLHLFCARGFTEDEDQKLIHTILKRLGSSPCLIHWPTSKR
jgi:hypothetical protein